MSSATRTRRAFGIDGDWTSAAVAGVAGGLVFGLLLQFGVGAMETVGALFGVPGLITGWLVHLAFSIGFALVFAGVIELETFEPVRNNLVTATGLGVAYGALLWLVNLAFIWPIWLNAVGFPAADAITVPYLDASAFVGHLVYGAIVGGVYPRIRRRS